MKRWQALRILVLLHVNEAAESCVVAAMMQVRITRGCALFEGSQWTQLLHMARENWSQLTHLELSDDCAGPVLMWRRYHLHDKLTTFNPEWCAHHSRSTSKERQEESHSRRKTTEESSTELVHFKYRRPTHVPNVLLHELAQICINLQSLSLCGTGEQVHTSHTDEVNCCIAYCTLRIASD